MARPKKTDSKPKSIFEELDGVGPRTAEKLEKSGIKSFIDVIIRGTKEYSRITELNLDQAEKHFTLMRNVLFEAEELPNVKSLSDKDKYDKKRITITTGCKELDDMFDGGISTQGVYVIYGSEGCGKTQFALSVLAEAIKGEHKSLFIDCENTLVIKRLRQILSLRGADGEQSIENLEKFVDYRITTDTVELKREVQDLIKTVHEKRFKLIIIDGLVGLERLEYYGRGELYERQSEIKTILKYLRNMAFHLNLAVVLTNQVTSNPDPFGEKEKGIGGHILGHYVRCIIQFKKAIKRARVATLKKAPDKPEAQYVFFVNEAGVSDVEEIKKPKVTTELVIDESKLKDTSLLEP